LILPNRASAAAKHFDYTNCTYIGALCGIRGTESQVSFWS
jgi:hypothetical protein